MLSVNVVYWSIDTSLLVNGCSFSQNLLDNTKINKLVQKMHLQFSNTDITSNIHSHCYIFKVY